MVDYPNVSELNIAINEFIANKFGIKTKFVRSSEFKINAVREERVINLCIAAGGTQYISGIGARVYQDEKHFTSRGIKLTYLDYKPIVYPQIWKEFIPGMSVVDYIFNCGYDWDYVLKEIAKQGDENGNVL